MKNLDLFINKRVKFRFFRQELQFDLSQSLFSSFDVDRGTRLLLKTIAKQVPPAEIGSVLDVGCGVGVIGLSLKKVNPAIALTVQDRDALALAFTQQNARLNKLAEVFVPGGLALQGLGDGRFDLIVSNLPGKAGGPVLADMLARMPRHLTETGRAAVVVVRPLADQIETALQKQGSEMLLKEAGKGYTVFHFRGGETAVSDDALTPYLRAQSHFQAPRAAYTLQTVYNVPEFDQLGFYTAAAYELLKGEKVNGRVLVWNPGQGHVPVYVARRWGTAVQAITLGSRDLLSLTISAHNLVENGRAPAKITTTHLPSILDLDGQFDFIAAFPDVDPGVAWSDLLPGQLAALLAPNGRVLLSAKSSLMQRLLPAMRQFTLQKDKKRRGFRAALLQKSAQRRKTGSVIHKETL